jgi:hypothetical protein
MEEAYLIKFYENLKNLSKNTIANHKSQLKKYLEMFKAYPSVHEVDVVENLDTIKNDSMKLSLLKSISKYRKVNGLPNEKILLLMKNTNELLAEKYKNRNILIKQNNSLPTYEYMVNELDKLYKEGEWKKYIINYLLLKLSIRNRDLDLKIVRTKADASDDNTNYIVIKKTSSMFIRNVYKTSKTYGKKINLIKSKKFVKAVNEYIGDKTFVNLLGYELKNTSNLSNVVRRQTTGRLKESDVLKIVLSSKNSLDQATKIGLNRGTNVQTLNSNYNIERTD